MPKTTDFRRLKRELLKGPDIRKEYDELGEEFQVAAEVIRARSRAKLTQAELAKKIGTKKPAISRLESPGYKASIATLRKVARATGSKLIISIVPARQPDSARIVPKAAAHKKA